MEWIDNPPAKTYRYDEKIGDERNFSLIEYMVYYVYGKDHYV